MHYKCVEPMGIDCSQNIPSKDMNLDLHAAVRSGNEATVRDLCEQGADLQLRDAQGFTPIFTAVEHGYLAIVELLIRYGCNLHDNSNWSQRSLLMCAAKRGRPECLRVLLHAGTSLRLRDERGLNALSKAVFSYPYNTECINLLYAAGDCAGKVLKEYSSDQIPYITLILEDHKHSLKLTELCRKVIRWHLIGLARHRQSNLFVTVPRLPLPRILRNFLLFNMDNSSCT